MILSRFLAKRRLAAAVRPSFIGAWGLVFVDFICVVIAVWLIFPVFDNWFRFHEPNVLVAFALMFGLFFIPSQAVLIVSAIWAAKSRWLDDDPKG